MKTIITYFIFLITIFLTNINNLYAVDVTGEATTYKNTIHALQLCETGSTLANCLNPITIGSSTSGKTMDLSVRGSANSFGNAGLITPGIGSENRYIDIAENLAEKSIFGGLSVMRSKWANLFTKLGGALDPEDLVKFKEDMLTSDMSKNDLRIPGVKSVNFREDTLKRL